MRRETMTMPERLISRARAPQVEQGRMRSSSSLTSSSASKGGPPGLRLVSTTHTTRHLRRVLLGAAHQSRPADRVVVSTDNDLTEIATLVAACADEFAMPIMLVQRPFRGASRSGQVRNNGVRAMLE